MENTPLLANNPMVFLVLGLVLAVLIWWISTLRKSGQSNGLAEQEMSLLVKQLQALSDGQERLAGGLHHVSEANAKAQTNMLALMEQRLAQVQQQLSENMHGSARRTAQSLGDLQQRLATIDKAQENITKLSGDVLSLQDILSNKQTRGAFGEIQLHDIVIKALPQDSFTMQATLSNGRRADCIIHLPNPPGPIAIDSKFPLEAYEAMRRASTEADLAEAAVDDMVEIETVDAEQADMVEIAAAVEADMVETDLQEKCTKQLVEIAVTNVKYHSNQAETNQFIVTIASKITNQQETTVDAEDISPFLYK